MKHLSLRPCSSSVGTRLSILAMSAATLLATGCGYSKYAALALDNPPSTTTPHAAMKGTVHGGQDPIIGAHVYLFEADNTGYGHPATSILRQADTGQSDSLGAYVTTLGPNGSWSISGDYACDNGKVVYLLATQGNPGVGGTINNAAIALMAVLGPCPAGGTFDPSLSVTIDELTTVAGAYALSGFMQDATHLSSPNTTAAINAINNAAANANLLVDTAAGGTRQLTPNGHGTVPAAEINTLGNILAYCINSDGGANCTSLFGFAPNSASVTPSDTLTAMLNIVHNPGAHAGDLFGLVGTKGDPFQPTLTQAPNDWSVEVSFNSASARDLPYSQSRIAFDSAGNLYIPHTFGTQQLGPDGTLLATNANNVGGYYAAISPIDSSVWTAGTNGLYVNNSSVTDYTTNYSGQEVSVAFDSTGNAWSGNQGPPSIGEFTGTTADVTTGYRSGGLQQGGGGVEGNGIAVDSQGDIWLLWRDNSVAAEVSRSGAAISSSTGALASTLYAPASLAIDASDNAWILGGNGLVTVFNKTAALVSGTSGYPTSGSLVDPQDLAIDGAGTVWISSGNGQALYSMSSAGTLTSPTNGYAAVTSYPSLLAIDGAGDIWVTDANTATIGEFIGLATPVNTPLTPGKLATRP